MEVYLMIGTLIVAFCAGLVTGIVLSKRPKQGQIVIEENEDKTRDCVRFILPIDIDEIKKVASLTFEVIDKTSKKEQSL